MTLRLLRALRKMTSPGSVPSWRPVGFDAMLDLTSAEMRIDDDAPPRRDGSSADLRERQRELAFDMYAEALMRITDEDDATHGRDRRETA